MLQVITITKNDYHSFLMTAESIKNVIDIIDKWIIVDGSDDCRNKEVISLLDADKYSYIPESSSGISSAFNDGIRHAKSEYLLFLNSGDIIRRDSIFKALQKLKNNHPEIYIGKVKYNNTIIGNQITFSQQLFRNYLPHQGMIIKRKLFYKYGLYDQNFLLGMDYEWSLRLKDIWSSIQFDDLIIVDMLPGGRSVTNYHETYRSWRNALSKNGYVNSIYYIGNYFHEFKHFVSTTLRNIVN
jgi:glycosyltransferase involved in cell wall biosynthesis